jgi:hypothetical protein
LGIVTSLNIEKCQLGFNQTCENCFSSCFIGDFNFNDNNNDVMKKIHTQQKSANRSFIPSLMFSGKSKAEIQALFGGKENSQTTKERGHLNTYPVYKYAGQKLGKLRTKSK